MSCKSINLLRVNFFVNAIDSGMMQRQRTDYEIRVRLVSLSGDSLGRLFVLDMVASS